MRGRAAHLGFLLGACLSAAGIGCGGKSGGAPDGGGGAAGAGVGGGVGGGAGVGAAAGVAGGVAGAAAGGTGGAAAGGTGGGTGGGAAGGAAGRDAATDVSNVDLGQPEDRPSTDTPGGDTPIDAPADRPADMNVADLSYDATPVSDAIQGDGAVVAPGLQPVCTASGWCWSNPLPQGEQLEVWGTSASDLWGVGPVGMIRHFDGSSWSSVPSGTTDNFLGVWGAAANDVWAVGAKGLVEHWNGSAWTPYGSFRLTTKNLYVVRGRAANDAWIGAETGDLYHWDGTFWTLTPSGINDTIFDIWVTPDGTVFLLGQLYGEIMRRRPGETSFSAISYKADATYTTFEHIWASGPNDVWAAGISGVVRYDGNSWRSFDFGGLYIDAVRGTGPNDVWLAGDQGAVFHYDGAKFDRWDTGTKQPLDRMFAARPATSGSPAIRAA